jgi:phage terminase large subunit-like protein
LRFIERVTAQIGAPALRPSRCKVLFPSQAPGWRDPLIEELADFPGGGYDDQVDALVYALERLRAAPRSPVGEACPSHS